MAGSDRNVSETIITELQTEERTWPVSYSDQAKQIIWFVSAIQPTANLLKFKRFRVVWLLGVPASLLIIIYEKRALVPSFKSVASIKDPTGMHLGCT